ncbi:MAG: alpha/beta hydrolase [Acidimicrobiia bacterium]|nr:alpha/beta hydrolase [Acidimicrobiia bacterium]MDH5237147.1 alpha/beta hydrolase [Acidimicrobiia bacterium]
MESSTVRSGQAELAVGTWAGDRSPIVALHPGVGDRRIWQWCAPVWAEAGFRVVAYDRRGFGATRYLTEPHDDLADLLAVTEANAARPAVVVGNSRGGGLALDLALRHPAHVAGLVLIAPSPSGFPDDDWATIPAEADQDELLEQAEASGDLDLVNHLEVRYWLDGVEQPEGRVAGSPRDLLIEMNGLALRAMPVGDAADHPSVWPRLAQIAIPTLVVVGAHDLPGIADLCGQLVETLPDARLSTIAHSAHCPSLDQPDELNRLVLDFVRSVVP